MTGGVEGAEREGLEGSFFFFFFFYIICSLISR